MARHPSGDRVTISTRGNRHEVYVKVNGQQVYGGSFKKYADALERQKELKKKQMGAPVKINPTEDIMTSNEWLTRNW